MINFAHGIKALINSSAGLKQAWTSEQAFRDEVKILVLTIIVLFLLQPGIGWSATLIAAWLLVMLVELLNTAIEEVFNLISPEYNIHVKHGKDLASAAVFMGLVINAFLWLIMLYAYFFGS